MLSVDRLSFARGGHAVFSGVGFEVGAGQVLQIHGPDGSGKTTLLRVLAGLLRPGGGTVCWRGVDTRAQPEAWRRSLAYLGHANAVSDRLTTIQNLRFAARLGAAVACLAADVHAEHAVLGRLGLAACEDMPARGLSQGQRRRVALARLLLEHKPLWLLDEPTGSLDEESASLIGACIEEHIGWGGTVLMTTRRPLDTAAVATRHLHFDGHAV